MTFGKSLERRTTAAEIHEVLGLPADKIRNDREALDIIVRKPESVPEKLKLRALRRLGCHLRFFLGAICLFDWFTVGSVDASSIGVKSFQKTLCPAKAGLCGRVPTGFHVADQKTFDTGDLGLSHDPKIG
jgi:hypothetical protein